MGVEIKGLKEFQGKLKKLGDNAKKLDGTHSILISDLLTTQFLSKCSQFRTAEELFEASGFKVETMEDFKAIPDEAWDNFIRSSTKYFNWAEMMKAAGAEWTKTQLGL